jgi:hypothetical protein
MFYVIINGQQTMKCLSYQGRSDATGPLVTRQSRNTIGNPVLLVLVAQRINTG